MTTQHAPGPWLKTYEVVIKEKIAYRVRVQAENEEDAEQSALESFKGNPDEVFWSDYEAESCEEV